MTRTIKIALTAAALSLTALSAANATDIVVSLKGKSNQQALADIKAAAATVCRADASYLDVDVCAADLTQETLKVLPKSFGK